MLEENNIRGATFYMWMRLRDCGYPGALSADEENQFYYSWIRDSVCIAVPYPFFRRNRDSVDGDGYEIRLNPLLRIHFSENAENRLSALGTKSGLTCGSVSIHPIR